MIEILWQKSGEIRALSVDELRRVHPVAEGTLWIDLGAPTAGEMKTVLEEIFAFHPVTIEDCRGFVDHPKIDEYGDYLFLVFHTPFYHEEELRLSTWEMDFFIGRNFVVTNHLKPVPFIPEIRERFRSDAAAFPDPGVLVQRILDSALRSHPGVLARLGRKLDEVEREVFTGVEHDTINDIYKIKRNLSLMRKVVLPQIEVLSELLKYEKRFFTSASAAYFNDLLNDLQRTRGLTESYVEMANDTFDAHLSLSSHRMNRIMRRLTVITTIFMPLTVVAGVGGMSEYTMMTQGVPWPVSYAIFVLLLLVMGFITYWILKRLKWV